MAKKTMKIKMSKLSPKKLIWKKKKMVGTKRMVDFTVQQREHIPLMYVASTMFSSWTGWWREDLLHTIA